jgi:flavin-dependent dehydrogenase
VGGGPAGLSTAGALKAIGLEAVVIDKDEHIGGSCRSVPVSEVTTMQIGPLIEFADDEYNTHTTLMAEPYRS